MKFSVLKKNLHDKLQYIISVVPSKTNLLVLSNLKIVASKENNTVTITATDLNITTIITIEANVLSDCQLLVPAKYFYDIVSSFSTDSIEFSFEPDKLSLAITSGYAKFEVNCVDISMFPEIGKIDSKSEYICNAEDFKKLIQNSVFCASTEQNQTIISGVFIKIENNLITFAATDTKRIGEAKLKTNIQVVEPFEIVVPSRALTFIEKNITSATEEITVKYDESRISFMLNDIVMISNKIEGRFPTYTVAFRNQPNYKLTLNKDEFLKAMKQASLLAEDEDRLIKIDIKSHELLVESHLTERGNAKISIPKIDYDGPESPYCFNSRLFTAILGVIETESVVLLTRSNEEPIWIQNNIVYENLEIKYVLMPLRIGR
ncbi:MAG: DNA polymerase III subunit beta [Candidatus Cloacimonetes bacterium]|nr:DNA polymerase III subunit beta [Candidatus Cloacimonadota bacterium]